MTSLLSLSLQPPQSLFLSSPINRPSSNPLYSPKPFNLHHKSPPLRHTITLIKFSFRPPSSLADFNAADGFIQDFFHKTEGLLYTLADAAVSVSASANGADKDTGDWFTGITNIMETVLKILKDGLSSLHVPYSYGFAIILLTVIVKAATFPLTKKQAESGMAMKSLQPQIKAIQQQYAGDQERIQLETARLYKVAGVNPLAGCLPTLATIPVWIGLYRALSNVANEGLLTEGFFWIPSLAGPTTVAARQNGSGISWIFPFVDGQPPLGWSDTLAYLVLPFLLIVSQYISVQIMQSSQSNDPNMKTSQALTKVLPLMIGYFALSVPSGLSLYWLTNNILSTTQQVWLQKLGGATNPVRKWDNSIKQVSQNLQELPIVDSTTKVVESIKEETPSGPRESIKEETPSGPRPGDRFKMLKEQEARKKKEREEAIKALNTEESIDDEKRIPVQKIENGSVDGKEEPVLNGKLKKEDETEMFTTNTTPVNGVEVEKREQEQVNKSNDK